MEIVLTMKNLARDKPSRTVAQFTAGLLVKFGSVRITESFVFRRKQVCLASLHYLYLEGKQTIFTVKHSRKKHTSSSNIVNISAWKHQIKMSRIRDFSDGSLWQRTKWYLKRGRVVYFADQNMYRMSQGTKTNVSIYTNSMFNFSCEDTLLPSFLSSNKKITPRILTQRLTHINSYIYCPYEGTATCSSGRQ